MKAMNHLSLAAARGTKPVTPLTLSTVSTQSGLYGVRPVPRSNSGQGGIRLRQSVFFGGYRTASLEDPIPRSESAKCRVNYYG